MNYEVNSFQNYESITIDELKDQANSLLNLVTEEQRPLRVCMNNGKEFLLFPQDLLAPICDSDFRLILLSAMRLLNFAVSFSETPLSQLKEYLSYINTFLSAKMMDTQVHPAYIFKQMHTFQLKINETVQAQELQHLPYEMVRKYYLLVKNFTNDNYSYLIRSVVNYINQHLSSELSLAALASEFGKNASYLSSEFKKEVGDTLTTYINKHRILASLRYFNTTDMSVAEVSNAVGYTDMGYFSRLFRKYVGQSPREYKKMLDK